MNARRLIRHIRFRRATGTGQTAFPTDGADFVAASGQNFMRISLMPHIPNQLVKRGVVDIVQRHSVRPAPSPEAKCPLERLTLSSK